MTTGIAYHQFLDRLAAVRQQIQGRCSPSSEGQNATKLLGHIESRLRRLPRIAILGEINSGKTSLANALIGNTLLHTDVIHNTRAAVLLRYSETPEVRLRRGDQTAIPLDGRALKEQARDPSTMIEVGVPLDCLKDFELIDTPGATSADEQMERTLAMSRQAHAMVWCTLGTQAWKASEVACCRAIGRRLGTSGVLAVTHADLLDVADREKVRQRLVTSAGPMFRSIALAAITGASQHDTQAPAGTPTGLDDIIQTVQATISIVQDMRCQQAKKLVRRFAMRMPDTFEIDYDAASQSSMPPPLPTLDRPAERLVAAE